MIDYNDDDAPLDVASSKQAPVSLTVSHSVTIEQMAWLTMSADSLC